MRSAPAILLAAAVGVPAPADVEDALPPLGVEVLPVFFVPVGEPAPTTVQAETFVAHLEWSRARFHEMLDCRDTFRLAPVAPVVVPGALTLADYQARPEGGAPEMTSEMLAHLGFDRFDLPYVLATVVMNPDQDWPPGGGRPCNGGFDTGGGIVVMSSRGLDAVPSFQSTLQHELGHAFGLPHVDVYGYDMATNPSIMSYNPAHHTDFFEPSDTPGILIPEDVRGLAFNDLALPRLAFAPATDLPPGYALAESVWLGPMTLPGQPDAVVGTSTTSGEAFGSSVAHAVQGRIRPSAGPGVTFDPASMWHTDPLPDGWADLALTFPVPVHLDRITVHSEHSGAYHRAEAVEVRAFVDGAWSLRADAALDGADAEVALDPVTARRWRLRLAAGASGAVTIRGLQFHGPGADGAPTELFPPFVPEPVTTACRWDLDGDGAVGFTDLVALLAAWGDGPPAAADLDCDGTVGLGDLVGLLARWDACG